MSVSRTEVETAIREFVHMMHDHRYGHEDAIPMNAAMLDDLGFDSIDNVELIIALEEEFDITIDDDKLPKWDTLQDVADVVFDLAGRY